MSNTWQEGPQTTNAKSIYTYGYTDMILSILHFKLPIFTEHPIVQVMSLTM